MKDIKELLAVVSIFSSVVGATVVLLGRYEWISAHRVQTMDTGALFMTLGSYFVLAGLIMGVARIFSKRRFRLNAVA
jgi:NAD(P)H-hydrate repair Nnr-like enzyme with NAD(P)H-hydrate dehydratase domain